MNNKDIYIAQLKEYENYNEVIKSPYDDTLSSEIFSCYLHEKKVHFLEEIKIKYPNIEESVANEMYNFMKSAYWYCVEVSDCIVYMYDTPFVPHTDEAKAIFERIVRVCSKRYPWIKQSDIRFIISQAMWLANR